MKHVQLRAIEERRRMATGRIGVSYTGISIAILGSWDVNTFTKIVKSYSYIVKVKAEHP